MTTAIIIDGAKKILNNKAKLEKLMNVKISNIGSEFSIDGESNAEYIAEKMLMALDMGFSFSAVLTIKEEDALFEIISIKDYTSRKDLEKVRARIIGAKGRTLRALTELTKCRFQIKDNEVGIVGGPEYIKNAQQAIIMLIQGSRQANVYAFLEKHQVEPVFDLGLKEVKGKKKK